MNQNNEPQIQIDLEQFRSKRSKYSMKQEAHRAFKKFKVGLPVTDYERKLIEIYYPFILEQEYNEQQKQKEQDVHDAFL